MKIFFICLLCAFYTSASGQGEKFEKNDPNALSGKVLKLNAHRVAPGSVKLPFSKINIIDSRFDTSKFGFAGELFTFNISREIFSKLRFEGGVGRALENYYNDYYAPAFTNNGMELTIVVKKLWYNETFKKDSSFAEPGKGRRIKGPDLRVKWEYYLNRKDAYLPVKRVDTSFTFDVYLTNYVARNFEEKGLPNMKFVFKMLIERYDFDAGILAFDQQKKKSREEIMAYNNKRMALPILKDSAIAKGIFLNFDEFRNNRPSITEYELVSKEGKEKDAGVTFKYKAPNLIERVFCYSDGKNLWWSGGKLKMYRTGNTFEWFTETKLTVGSRTVKAYVPHQVDMETGEIY